MGGFQVDLPVLFPAVAPQPTCPIWWLPSKYLIYEYIAAVQIISNFFLSPPPFTLRTFHYVLPFLPLFSLNHKYFVMRQVRITPVGQLPISQELFSTQPPSLLVHTFSTFSLLYPWSLKKVQSLGVSGWAGLVKHLTLDLS